jgi:hypothetical protein
MISHFRLALPQKRENLVAVQNDSPVGSLIFPQYPEMSLRLSHSSSRLRDTKLLLSEVELL